MPTNPDLEGIAEDIYEITGTRVKVGVVVPHGLPLESGVHRAFGLPEDEED